MKLFCHFAALLLPAGLLLAGLMLAAPLPAAAQPGAPPFANAPSNLVPDITPAQAQNTLEVLRDDKKRSQLIETLQTIARAGPAEASKSPATGAAPVPSSGTPSSGVVAKPPAAAQQPALVSSSGLARQLMGQVWDWADRMAGQLGDAAKAVTDFPLLWRWATHTAKDPGERAWALATLWKLALVLGCGLAVEWLLAWLLGRPYRELERHAPAAGETSPDAELAETNSGFAAITVQDLESDVAPEVRTPPLVLPVRNRRRFSGAWMAVQRLPFAFAGMLLRAIPIAGFAIVANLLTAADLVQSSGNTRLAITAVANAYVLFRIIMCVTRLVVSEDHPRLALVRMKAENAAYVEVWVRRIAVLALFGIVLAESTALLGLTQNAREALLKLVALVVHICFVIIVLQCRRGVAGAIRAQGDAHGAFATFRNRLASLWHYLAAALIIALWVVWAIQVRDGLANMLRFIVVTLAVLGVARLVLMVATGSLDRLFHLHPEMTERYPGLEARANRYYPLLRGMVSGAIWLATMVALLEAWGLSAFAWFGHGRTGDRLVSALVTIAVAVIAAIVIWESVNAALDRHLARLSSEQQTARVARVKTLLPILRNILLIAIIVILGLTVLNQVGVNIAPLLAGAGIIGVALGFGSQKLVQDLITGLFLLLENAMQVGDWVTAGGLSGSVETLSIRTMRLRAGDGSLHIIPFSAVTTVTNTNRGVGNAAVSVNVALKEDPDRVGEVLKAIAAEMREDPKFAPGMQSDLQLWGVDKVDASVMTIVGQIVCTDSGRWGVQREFNRRVRLKFQDLGIQIANPTHTIVLAQPAVLARPDAAVSTGDDVPEMTNGARNADATTTADSPPPAALGHTE